jgi:hypothetical protein
VGAGLGPGLRCETYARRFACWAAEAVALGLDFEEALQGSDPRMVKLQASAQVGAPRRRHPLHGLFHRLTFGGDFLLCPALCGLPAWEGDLWLPGFRFNDHTSNMLVQGTACLGGVLVQGTVCLGGGTGAGHS